MFFLHNKKIKKGFVLPFTMLMSTLVLFITGSAMTLVSKQMYFSKLYRNSQNAYYAADDAITCALAIDDTYTSADGLGIFPSSTTTPAMTSVEAVIDYVNDDRASQEPPLDPISLAGPNPIKCAQSLIFDQNPATSDFKVSDDNYTYYSPFSGDEEGKTVTYRMRMNMGGGEFRCARVTVNKTPSFRQIIAQGYSSCNDTGAIERAVINTTISE